MRAKARKRLVTMLLATTLASPAAVAQVGDRVTVGAFAIDRTEVTIAQFRLFATNQRHVTAAEREGGGFEYAAGWIKRPGWIWSTPFGRSAAAEEPTVHVSWHEAHAYCAYAGGRLPTFEEWRLAAYTETRDTPTDGFARGRTYTYPVGDTPDGMNNSRQSHVPVGTTKRGVNGLFDMGANVWEWLADRRQDDALTAGGSWWYGPAQTQVSGVQWKPANFYAVYVGFRCVYDAVR